MDNIHVKYYINFLILFSIFCFGLNKNVLASDIFSQINQTIISNQINTPYGKNISVIVCSNSDEEIEIPQGFSHKDEAIFHTIPGLFRENFIIKIKNSETISCIWNPLQASPILNGPPAGSGIIDPKHTNKEIVFIRIFSIAKLIVCKIKFKTPVEFLNEFEDEIYFMGSLI